MQKRYEVLQQATSVKRPLGLVFIQAAKPPPSPGKLSQKGPVARMMLPAMFNTVWPVVNRSKPSSLTNTNWQLTALYKAPDAARQSSTC